MTASGNNELDRALHLLEANGFLLLSGTEIPDVCGVVSATRTKGSWWGSPHAHQIFAICETLSDHPDVTSAKLVSGKVTFIHRELWHALVAIGRAREDWQVKTLSAAGRRLLDDLDQNGTLSTNSLGNRIGPKPGNVARELELKLLLHADQVHTDSGKHAKILETWDAWSKRVRFKPRLMAPELARRLFEERLDEINQDHRGNGRLPWIL